MMTRSFQEPRRPVAGFSEVDPNHALTPAGRLALICAGLVLVTFVGFRGVLTNGFVNFDDDTWPGAIRRR